MNKNIKITLVFLGIILLGGFIVLSIQEPPSIEWKEIVLEIEESEDLVINQELEELIDEEPEKEEEGNEEIEKIEETEGKTINDFVQCLKEEGVVIYGSTTCPACSRLEEGYGGYEIIKPIYLDCSRGTEEELAKCREEMKTNFVPEIQIKGELFDEWGSPEALAKETGCEL